MFGLGPIGTVLVVGAGVLAASRLFRPVLSLAVSGGVAVYRGISSVVQEAGEVIGDIVAEARADLEKPGE